MNELVTGPYETYILEDTFSKFLKRLSDESGESTAICWFDRRGVRCEISYMKLYEDSLRVSGWIHSMGYSGEYIGLSMSTSYEWFVSFFGIILSGNAAVLMDPSADESTYGNLAYVIHNGEIEYLDGYVAHHEPDDTAAVVFTSGTTGEPKGAELSHRGILLNAYESNLYIDDRGHRYVPLPFFHAYALTCGALSTFASRSILYISPKETKLARDFRLADPYTVISVPMVLEFLSHHVTENMRLMSCVCGGAPVPEELMDRLAEMGVSTYQGYGITECSPLVSVNGERGNRRGSVGKPLPSFDVHIDDVTSEIILRGPSVMKGYMGCDRCDGIFHTGDTGYADEDGYIYVTGRMKSLIVMNNGKKVSPESIEAELMDFVQEAHVYGIPGGIYGYEIAADIYDAGDRDEIERHIEEFNYMRPQYMRIRHVTYMDRPFARTATGKIRRKENE